MKPSSRFLNWRGKFGSAATEGPHRLALPEEQRREYPVTVEIKGTRYTGFYTVSSSSIRLRWGGCSTRAGASAERTARLLLLDLLRRAKVLRPTPSQNP